MKLSLYIFILCELRLIIKNKAVEKKRPAIINIKNPYTCNTLNNKKVTGKHTQKCLYVT